MADNLIGLQIARLGPGVYRATIRVGGPYGEMTLASGCAGLEEGSEVGAEEEFSEEYSEEGEPYEEEMEEAEEEASSASPGRPAAPPGPKKPLSPKERRSRRRAVKRAMKRARRSALARVGDIDPRAEKVLTTVDNVLNLIPAARAGKEIAKIALRALLNNADPEKRAAARKALAIHG